MDYIIKKLGGENAAELHKSSKNIYEDFIAGTKQAVVVSAIRSPDFNTTDKLIELGKVLAQENIDIGNCEGLIGELRKFHLQVLEQKLLCSRKKMIEVVKAQFDFLTSAVHFYICQKDKEIVPKSSNDYAIILESGEYFSILGFGEIICCRIFSCVVDSLSSEGICSKSIDLSNIVLPREVSNKSDEEVFNILSTGLAQIIEDNITGGHIPVLSGYMGFFDGGIEASIGRGYSDATAAACTVGLSKAGHKVVLEIQKSVPGLMSADPRILDTPEDAVVLQQLDYLTAREITGDCGAQAKLLHHQALRSQVQEAGVKIHLFDPFSGTEGSWIINKRILDEQSDCCKGVSFIGGRKNVIFFSISTGKMFRNGILSRLFDIVQNYFGVDVVSTSESEVSFTIDGNGVKTELLDKMRQELRDEFNMPGNSEMEFIEYTRHKSLIFCVGLHMRDHIGIFSKATTALSDNNINVEIASQGRLQRSIIFGIDEKDMRKAVNVLHTEFIV